jgi:hypothetical protein
MAGTLFLPGGHFWAPAGWVYDNALERMACILQPGSPSLAGKLLDSRTDINGGFLDLRGADIATLRLLLDAGEEAYRHYEAAGANSFSRPEFYPGFMKHLAALRELLRLIASSE